MESALYGIYALCAHSFDFWYKNNECVNTVQGTLLYTYRDIQHFASFFISKLSNPKIAKICRYTPRNDKEKTLHKNYNLSKDVKKSSNYK